MTQASSPKNRDKEDHRIRVARQKRERMRSRLLDATLEVYHTGDQSRAAVIDDVVRQAGVSRGTFYKYFESLEDAVEALGATLADESLFHYKQMFSNLEDAGVRSAGGAVLPLARAAMEPRWASFTSRVDITQYLSPEDPLHTVVFTTLQEAQQAGLLDFDSLCAATDMLTGALLAGMRRLSHGEQRTRAYVTALAGQCMVGLGMPRGKATNAVEGAWRRIEAHAADLPWWHSLEEKDE